MVELVRQGWTLRAVAQRFRVSPNTVRLWVQRSAHQPLEVVDWADRPRAPHHVHNRTAPEAIHHIVACRHALAAADNPLGFIGAAAISEALQAKGITSPSLRTINRILHQHGLLDYRHRVRRAAPPPGWYLPDVASGAADLDAFDVIEGLALEGQGAIDVTTGISLWTPAVQAWPAWQATARQIVDWLTEHWRVVGLPAYAQFDNDTRFQGTHTHPDIIGRVSRLCVSLGVIPVFVPPQETGFQALIEHFNGLWQRKVWHRLHHEDLATLTARSARFIAAYRRHRVARMEHAPRRRPFPAHWRLDLQAPPRGRLIYLRRTDAHSTVAVMGHRFRVEPLWPHRLVRCTVDLDAQVMHVVRLRRREPEDQPLLMTQPYHFPRRRFLG
jgi:hypothetical protein